MRLRKLPYLFLLTFCVFGFFRIDAQSDARADSLFAIWSDKTNSQEDRVEAFYQRFNPLVDESHNPEAMRWAPGLDEVMELAPKVGKEEYMGRFLCLVSGAYFVFYKDFDKACELGLQTIDISFKVKDYASASAILHFMKSCPGIDIITLLEGKISLDTLEVEQIPIYTNLVRSYYISSRLPEALALAQRVIVFAEASTPVDHFNLSETLQYVGSTHSLIGNYDEAERYLLPALEHGKKSNFDPAIGGALTELAYTHIRKKDFNVAQTYLDSATVFMKDKQDCESCMAKARWLRAGVKNLKGNYQEALEDLLAIKVYYDSQPVATIFNIGIYYSELSNAYLGLGQYKNAIEAALSGIEKTDGNLFSSVQSYENIYKAYTALGNDKMAFEYYQKYISARDEITKVRNSQQVTKQELAFQYEQKRLTDSLQQEFVFQQEISRQKNSRNIFIALGVIAAMIAIGVFSRLRFIRRTQKLLVEKNRTIEAEKEKAQASERAKHQFLANMSHEIRTPMNAIKGMTDILIRRDPRPEQSDFLKGIKQSSDSLLVIINDILDISKIEAGKIELEKTPFQVSEVLDGVQTIMQFKAEEKGLELQKDTAEALPELEGDPTRLRQILINLVSNAIKFTEKGVVSIRTKILQQSEQLVELQFTVSDTGVGIGADRLDKIFETFEQAYSDTTRKFGGTGLGLSISKKLVELQGGSIWVESEKGKGSQFHFTIPFTIVRQNTEQLTVAKDSKLSPSLHLNGLNILLVEDNTFNAIVAQEELEDAIESVVVDLAENGAIAVEKVRSGSYDIILMDVQMPVMNGYEATQKIRELMNGKSATPIIAMTANVMKEEVERCYEAGMDDFIGKPFDTEDLLSKLAKLIKKEE